MKNILRAGLMFGCLLLCAPPARAAETFALDPMHTAVTWTISHFGFSHPWGKFSMITGELVLDEKNLQKSKIRVKIPMAQIATGLAELDDHLKSKEFFDIATYPEAAFVSDKIVLTGKQTATVEGILTMHGVSKPVILDVKLNKLGMNMFKKKTAGFSAAATIKRSDFGISAYVPDVGDKVQLYIESEANLADANGSTP